MQNLRPLGQEAYFHVGSYFHELAHFYYQLVQAGFPVGSDGIKKAMQHKMEDDLANADPYFLNIYVQVHIMFDRYLKQRTEIIDRNIKVAAVEVDMILPLDDEIGLRGIMDLAYYQKNRLIIRDHKTGQNKSAHSDSKMEFQDQTLFYACLWWKIHDELPDYMEVSWINSKTDYSTKPGPDKLFASYRLKLTEELLTGFWNYLLEYVSVMRSNKPIRRFNTQCDRCRFRIPCLLDLKGMDVDKVLANNYKTVDANYDQSKFTQISTKDTAVNISLEEGDFTSP